VTANDRTSALRSRRDQTSAPVPNRVGTAGRPADLVITADMIPDPVTVDAAGDLTNTELHDLGVCERAVDNLSTARWLAGKALQSIRDRKLYRHTHSTFEEYVQDRWEMSERAAYQTIEEWPLAERLQQILGKPTTPSHTRALLPVAHRFGVALAVDLYQQLGPRAATDGLRLTAALTARVVQAILQQTGTKAEAPQFQEAARQLMSAPALPALETKARTTAPPPAPTAIPSEPSNPLLPKGFALDAHPSEAETGLQNFAGDNGRVTAIGIEVTLTDASADRDYFSESPSPESVIRFLKLILHKVRDVEDAIDSLIGVDPFHDGETEDLRQEIHRRLLRAAEPYKPYTPSNPRS
jgi:hypothetical protein